MTERELLEQIIGEKKVTVVDAPCGKGKTQYAIQHMRDNADMERFIFITPFLDEVARIKRELPHFKEPLKEHGLNKRDSIKSLLANGHDIVSTHQLFLSFDPHILNLIIGGGYTLILDEVVNGADMVGLGKDALNMLVENGRVITDENNRINWVEGVEPLDIDPLFNRYQRTLQNKECYFVRDSVVVWTIDPCIFSCFDEVFVLTYMFNGSTQKYLFDAINLEFETKQVIKTKETEGLSFEETRYELVSGHSYDMTIYKDLINIYEGKLNSIGKKGLSATWYRTSKKAELLQVEKSLHGYFNNAVKAKASDRLWTVQEDYKQKIQGRYANQHLSITSRGTNEYRHITNMAYMSNRYMNPMIKAFFEDNFNVVTNQDAWALSEMIQWIFRSAVRNGEPINLFVPSYRMRNLLKYWLNNGQIK